jgi:hypothetical protein
MRIVSSWRTTCTTKSSREGSVYPIAPSRASSSAVASTKRKKGVEEDLAGLLEIYIVLAQIDGCLLGVPYKGLPAKLKPSVHELQCIYIACTRQAAYLFECATRNVRRADIGGLGSAVSAARLHSRRVEGALRARPHAPIST